MSSRLARWAICGSWLVAGAMSFASLASPILPEYTPASPYTARDEGMVSDGYSRSLRHENSSAAMDRPALPAGSIHDEIRADRDMPGRPESLLEINLRGPGESVDSTGIDDDALSQRSLLRNELLRGFGSANGPRPGPPESGLSGRNRGGPTPDIFGEAVDNALKMARDAIFDGNDMANFSVAGFEVSVMLKGDRRSVSLNGDDFLGANPDVTHSDETWQAAAASRSGMTPGPSPELAAGQYFAGEPDGKISIADIYKFVTNPMTILGALVALSIWLLLSVADRPRS